ncbi:MAG TPA: YigZ family protein [Xanthomonadales bacterium]|nr:YigZ family protein [Xanthomonadales bacterium]
MVIRQSRFIAHAAPVADQAATLAFFEAVADPAATHNCWAWRLEHGYRFNDDGEPGSTAGRPILAAIDGKNLCRAMVVVTRHFGGIKLGVGGLIRAYSGAAARCLDHGELIEIHATSQCIIEAGFEWTGPVHAAVEACGAVKKTEEYTAGGIRLLLEVREDRWRKLQALLRDSTRGEARLARVRDCLARAQRQ